MVKTKTILAYSLLPQIRPRISDFLSAGFSNLASFMAVVYQSVRLLPNNHPYLQPNMSGKYGVLDVLREASSNLKFTTRNIDQVIVFFALLIGMALLAVQAVLLLTSLMVSSASAAGLPAGIGEFFVTEDRGEDLALRMLDAVFGVPEIFGTNQATGTAFHTALQELFQFYSIGLLVIAAIILAYYIFAILAETAQTGTPFGRRYNHAWAPVRLVVAIGLLVPIGSGLNAAQWITLYSAKYGSAFATNGWIQFNNTMADTLVAGDELIAVPNTPALNDVVAFMYIAHACKAAYIEADPTIGNNINGWIISPDNTQDPLNIEQINTPWSTAAVSKMERIHVRFGVRNDVYSNETSNVYPFCGEIVITNNVPAEEIGQDSSGNNIVSAVQIMTWRYYALVQGLWEENRANMGAPLNESAREFVISRMISEAVSDPDQGFKTERNNAAVDFITDGIGFAADSLKESYEVDDRITTHGWGGAGIWYNQIAAANGVLTDAIMTKPVVSMYPSVMEYTCKKNKQENTNTSQTECFDPRLSKGKEAVFKTEKDRQISAALSSAFNFWYEEIDSVSGNIIIDTINALLGTQGIFDMCRNADIHPLAQLSATGKGLMQAAISNLAIASGTGVLGMLNIYNTGPALLAASKMLVSFASIGILIGFILFYVIPFMPFLYFFFAVGGWVKGLFEAMVGVPLWALAHLRIDGQGLAGDAAINGYFLIFEIFIRPILIIFGLLASFIIFAAMVKVLNEIFSLVVSNLAGFSTANASQCGVAFEGSSGAPTGSIDYLRGPVDEFFFTVVYAILVYMIGMASFKLIDRIPNQILRWMGAGVSTFNDDAGEPAEGLVSKLAVGGGIVGGQLQQAGQAGAQAAGGFGSLASKFVRGE